MEYLILTVIAFAVVVYILWRLDEHRKQKDALLSEQYAKARLSDEAVLKAQAEFEKRLEANIDLPDGIRWGNAFIYWQLMRTWFASLLASSRYTGASDKIKSDWLDYMALMEERATQSFLSSIPDNEEQRQTYYEREIEVSRKIAMIEDGMAAAVGQEAIKQLQAARNAPSGTFDVSGKKPMAPTGFHYSPTSIRPYVEELVPDK